MKSDNLTDHIMHKETFSISAETLHLLHAKAQNTNICVGTTSLRTIESMYIAAHFINESSDLNHINIGQWDYQHIGKFMSRQEAWEHLIKLADKKNVQVYSGYTSLMITPDYHCKTTDMLITNFHQPDSTLLLIVASFIGTKWREVYDHALNNNYRFLSYGDACLLKNDKL
jgi:S-adenosylmethionine:tRNA ribosyltransferase-isomerase